MRRFTFFLGVTSGAIPVMLFMAMYILSQPVAVWPLPLDWVADGFPQHVEVCPGDTIEYRLGIWEKVEGPVQLIGTIDRGSDHPDVEAVRQTEFAQELAAKYNAVIVGDTVEVETSPIWIILGGDDEEDSRQWENRLRVDIDSTAAIPEDLTPGPYIRKLAVVWVGRPSEAAIRLQRFAVKSEEECNAIYGD